MNKMHFRAMGHIERSQEENDDLILFGVASASNLDRKGTFIDQDSLWEAASRSGPRPLFWEHDWGAPIGTVEEFARGEDALLARSRVGKDFEIPVVKGLGAVLWSVNNIRTLVRQNIVRGYSIGFDGDKVDDKNGGPPTIIVRDLMEVSICSLPANPKTMFGFGRAMVIGDEPRPPAVEISGNKITPMRFEFAAEQDDEEELEVLKVALRSLQEAVADWK